MTCIYTSKHVYIIACRETGFVSNLDYANFCDRTAWNIETRYTKQSYLDVYRCVIRKEEAILIMYIGMEILQRDIITIVNAILTNDRPGIVMLVSR